MATPSGFLQTADMSVFSGYPFFQIGLDSEFITMISGNYSSNIRIFETSTDLFVHRLGSLLQWDGGVKFVLAGPDCAVISETSDKFLISAWNDSFRHLAHIKSASHITSTVSGWIDEGVLSGFTARDSVSDNTYFREVPTLIGSTLANTYPRIVRNDLNFRPFGDFTRSDAGITQISPEIAQITDIEAV